MKYFPFYDSHGLHWTKFAISLAMWAVILGIVWYMALRGG